ncbi:MAG: cellulose synthase operon protein YhjQ/BcsQ [Pseudomonadota bacterium]
MRSERDFGFGDQAAGLRKLLARDSAQVITVLGARDGAGATSLVTGLAALFAHSGKDVLVLDENLSQDNVANTLALRPRYDLLHAARGDKTWQDVLLQGMAGPGVLPVARAMQTLPQLSEVERERLLAALLGAAAGRDVVLVDAARDGNSVCAGLTGDESLLLVMNPTASGITEAYALLKKLAMHNGRQAFDIVVNRVGNERDALRAFDNMSAVAQHHLQVRLSYLGYIPVDEKLQRATQLCRPVVEAFPSASASMAMREIAQGVLRGGGRAVPAEDRLGSMMQRLVRMAQPRNVRPRLGSLAALT